MGEGRAGKPEAPSHTFTIGLLGTDLNSTDLCKNTLKVSFLCQACVFSSQIKQNGETGPVAKWFGEEFSHAWLAS